MGGNASPTFTALLSARLSAFHMAKRTGRELARLLRQKKARRSWLEVLPLFHRGQEAGNSETFGEAIDSALLSGSEHFQGAS